MQCKTMSESKTTTDSESTDAKLHEPTVAAAPGVAPVVRRVRTRTANAGSKAHMLNPIGVVANLYTPIAIDVVDAPANANDVVFL